MTGCDMRTAKREVEKSGAVEEDVEFSNVTNLRESLLSRVESLRANPSKRYVITKHGQPQAVLMSYGTYSLLKKMMDQTLARAEAESKSDPIGAAFARFREDHPNELSGGKAISPPAVQEAVSAALQTIRAQFEQLDAVLGREAVNHRK
jgi:prevent-host-death family protein